MNLFSENDWKSISKALRRMEPLTLTRTLDDTELTVCVKEAGKAWPVAMLVQVRVRKGRVEWIKNCASVEEALKSLV